MEIKRALAKDPIEDAAFLGIGAESLRLLGMLLVQCSISHNPHVISVLEHKDYMYTCTSNSQVLIAVQSSLVYLHT